MVSLYMVDREKDVNKIVESMMLVFIVFIFINEM